MNINIVCGGWGGHSLCPVQSSPILEASAFRNFSGCLLPIKVWESHSQAWDVYPSPQKFWPRGTLFSKGDKQTDKVAEGGNSEAQRLVGFWKGHV